MSNNVYICPWDNTKVTRQFVEDKGGRWALWFRCERGHFFGQPHWQEAWEYPEAEPPDPDLELWPEEPPPAPLIECPLRNTQELLLKRRRRLTLRQFLVRAVPATVLGSLSLLVAIEMLLAPYVRRLLTTLI